MHLVKIQPRTYHLSRLKKPLQPGTMAGGARDPFGVGAPNGAGDYGEGRPPPTPIPAEVPPAPATPEPPKPAMTPARAPFRLFDCPMPAERPPRGVETAMPAPCEALALPPAAAPTERPWVATPAIVPA